jgi:membrane protease YdiL (CAAX protease family)
VNVGGEELWWRGYVLPRQELTLGANAWFVHGLLWTAFHVVFYWQLLMILPITLAIAFVSQRTKSTWPAIVGHALLNWGTFPFLVRGFLGQ